MCFSDLIDAKNKISCDKVKLLTIKLFIVNNINQVKNIDSLIEDIFRKNKL